MSKFEYPHKGETFYFEVSKLRDKPVWEVRQRGVLVATLTGYISAAGAQAYAALFHTGESLNIQADTPEKAVKHLAKHYPGTVRVSTPVFDLGQPSAMAQSQEDSQEPEIWPIPDLADWPDSVLAENLAIYKAEPPDAYMEYRINELEAEIERREAISRRAMQEPSGALQPESGDGTLSVLGELGCPPLTIQFGEVGGLRLDTAPEVGSVLAAISVALEDDGHRELAEHVRKLWTTGIAPILESKKTNG